MGGSFLTDSSGVHGFAGLAAVAERDALAGMQLSVIVCWIGGRGRGYRRGGKTCERRSSDRALPGDEASDRCRAVMAMDRGPSQNDVTMFCQAFRALQGGNDPFPWQQRLFLEFVSGRLPAALDLP